MQKSTRALPLERSALERPSIFCSSALVLSTFVETINFCIHVLGLQRLNKGDAFLREYFKILNEPFWAKTGQTSDCQGGDTPRKLIQKHQNDFCRQVHSGTLFLDVCSSNLRWKPCGFIFFRLSATTGRSGYSTFLSTSFAGANLKPGILTMALRNIWAHPTGTLEKREPTV